MTGRCSSSSRWRRAARQANGDYHAAEVVAEVCRVLGVPYQTHGYRPKAR
jgi:hypothetical protein